MEQAWLPAEGDERIQQHENERKHDHDRESLLTTDTLNVEANASMFQRFDNFNDSYEPLGAGALRTIFMKTSNAIDGRFFAELTRDVTFKRITEQPNIESAEPRSGHRLAVPC